MNYQLIIKIWLFLLIINCSLFIVPHVSAQTLDPTIWQNGATGLKLQPFRMKRANLPDLTGKTTSGLSIAIQDTGKPSFLLHGGVGGEVLNQRNIGPIGINLGVITNNLATTSATLTAESADWAHNEITYNGSTPDQLKITASRLTSSILINNSKNFLRLFTGPVFSYLNGAPTPNNFNGKVVPKYIAFSSGGVIQVRQLTTTTSLPALDNNWILIWFGSNTHFTESKQPNPYPFPFLLGCCGNINATVIRENSYLADAPLLLTFQNNPTSITPAAEGGIDLTFATSAGYSSVLPIYGRDHLKASDTEVWGTSGALPQTVKDKINFWVQRSCQYPSTVSESYSYNQTTDTATITNNLTFIPVCSFSTTKFAPISSVLGVARNALGNKLTFSNPVIDGNLPTDFGPTLGLDNVSTYSWNLRGINNYLNYNNPATGISNAPPELMTTLRNEVDKITATGHYSPWMVADKMTANADMGDLYFLNPADILIILTEIIPVLPEPQKTNLINYIKSERVSYPPESVFNLTLGEGTIRGDFMPHNQTLAGASPLYTRWRTTTRPELFMKRVWLYNFYSLYRYYQLTGEAIPPLVLTNAITTLNNDMKEQDFASMYWFKGFQDRKVAVVNANRHIAGLIGTAKIATALNDSGTTNLVKPLLAKAAVLRVGMAKMPSYRNTSGLEVIPPDPAWQPKMNSRMALIFDYNWTTALDDTRQVVTMDQFGVALADSAGFNAPFSGIGGFSGVEYHNLVSAYLTAFRDLVPETALILKEFAKLESLNYANKVAATMPHWYFAYAEAYVGAEHGLSLPIDSYQLFLAKAWIGDESATNLDRYSDVSWLSPGGDLFYIHKLALAAKAYASSGSPAPSASQNLSTPPPPTKPGDTDLDGDVDIFDYNNLLTDFNKTGTGLKGDFDNNGKVDIFDYNTLLSNFGK